MYIRDLRTVGGAPLVIEQASIDINMAPHSAHARSGTSKPVCAHPSQDANVRERGGRLL